MAEIVATGNLGADAELRTTPSGRPVLNFRMGDSKSKKNDQGGWDTVAENWFNVTIWGELAQFYANQLKKGVRVKITGEFYQREYDKKDGSGKGVALEVTAWGVQILTPPSGRSAGATNQTSANTHQPGPGWGNNTQQQPQQGGGWNAPNNDPWSTGGGQSQPQQNNGGGWGNPGANETPF
mgnify:CR=1 FL=1